MKIIIAAGGSGGHIFPAVVLASELRKKGVEDILLVSSRRDLDKNILKEYGFPSFFLSINPMPLGFYPLRILVFAMKFMLDIAVSFFIILRQRPDAVVGFGGYSSGAAAVAGKVLGIPVIIHEQNLSPGRANRILGRIADVIAVSFEGSKEYFKGRPGRVRCTGNPLRVDMLINDRGSAAAELGMDPCKFTVLVMGGSQGSSFLNKAASEAALCVKRAAGEGVQFLHLTGKKDHDRIKEFYRSNDVEGKVFSFMERIDRAYSVSDLAISRSGAAAVFELAYYGKPMILVPYPHPKNNQRSNAAVFFGAGAAVYREEPDITGESLGEDILGLLRDKEKLRVMALSAARLARPSAGPDLADAVIGEAEKKREKRKMRNK
ncbi:MAG: undecaprenyldiphospho-muramoylpentapeptide beta-N-acetylglucosaminyltransferase [Candidatus Omnitrophota bacterium]|nr:undecaprenyldiphospho-muramoylpentapeptide beta-N-acetylglucosaminyltransferase [Candidatus Omnitrophota bacterium]